jgi:ankyrin repeat protein
VTALDNLRKAAKRWLKALRDGDVDARARLLRAHPSAADPPTLRDVQHALARERGCENWTALKKAAVDRTRLDTPLSELLAALLDLHPAIANERGRLEGHFGLRTALHFGVAHLAVVRTLLERGVEIDPHDSIYKGTPLGWAAHGDKTEMVRLLSRHSRDIWTLCFQGHVDRVREILPADPGLAKLVGENGYTPLWWLPDDEVKAMELVTLLVGAGANPSARNREGRTAADWARRRGMREIAAWLDRAAAAG